MKGSFMSLGAAFAGHGRGLDVSPVAGVLANHVDAFEDGEGGLVVVFGEHSVGIGECGRRHGAYDTAPHSSEVTSSTKHVRISERVPRTSTPT